MHELGIARDLWAVAQQCAREQGLHVISRMVIVIGDASGFERGFLEHSLSDHVLPGTIAASAELQFVSEPLAARCRACGGLVTVKTIKALGCPSCSSADLEIVSGKETYVKSIEGE